MRILLACEFYHPSVGGVQEVMRQLAEHLVTRGHDVTIATTYLPERHGGELNGVAVAEFKVSGNRVRGLSGDVDSYRRFVLNADYDLFMVKAAQQWTFDALWPILAHVKRPIVFVPCGFSALYNEAYREYFSDMPQILGQFTQLIFYGSNYRDIRFARELGLSNISILSNAASEREFGVAPDAAFRSRHGIPEDAFVVLTVGTFTGGLKGHRELAEAFERADFEGRRAVLILNGNVMTTSEGSPLGTRSISQAIRHGARKLRRTLSGRQWLATRGEEQIASLVARINRAASAKRAMIADLPRTELVQAYLNSDLFVLASKIECSPLVLFEAAAAGLPFLTVPVGNAAEVAQWTGGGIVCPARCDSQGYTLVDPTVLAEHISRLAAAPQVLDRLGREGRRRWSEQFTWDIVAGKYEAIFARLIEQNRTTNV